MGPHGSLLTRAIPQPFQLPKVEWSAVPTTAARGVADKQHESYGFNSGADWEQPDGYIRWLQPIEADLAKQVEYDMDDIDKEWLDAVNGERSKQGHEPVSYEFFEILMDKLEKEWFELSARIPKPASAMAIEDSKCAICDDGECENSNAIVFCDGCNLAVHQDCYGVPYIPEGQWLCRKCTVSPDKPVSCCLCPAEGGAFKQTTKGGWAHLLCAIWVPETGVSNTIYMEPVDGVEAIPKSRWRLICYLCKKRVGACIQCSNRACFTAFHVTCARDYGLHLRLRVQSADYKAFCHKHEPREMGAIDTVEPSEEEASQTQSLPNTAIPNGLPLTASAAAAARKRKRGDDPLPPPKPQKKVRATPKTSRAHSKTFASGPPIIPFYIHTRLWEYVDRVKVRNKKAFVALACRYWSLKREARRGAPLLKRLHLEPWTAAAANGQQSDAEKAKKLKLITRLRADLENVRMLCELVRKREKEKLRRAQLLKTLIDDHMFPYTAVLRESFQKITALDRSNLFAQPVSRAAVPDYFDIVKEPMDWSTISDKLERHEYFTAASLAHDVRLVFSNATLYNPSESSHAKAADKLAKAVEPILTNLIELDDPTSAFQRHAAELMGLLDEDLVEAFHEFKLFSPKLPSPPPIEMSSPKAKKRKREVDVEEVEDVAEPDVEEEAESEVDEKEAKRLQAREAAKEKKAREKQKREERRQRDKEKREAARAEAEQSEEVDEDDDEEAADRSLEVKDVTNHDSFLSFNTGWILPEGARRRGRDAEAGPSRPKPERATKKAVAKSGDEAESSDLSEAESSPPRREKAPAKPRRASRGRSEKIEEDEEVEDEPVETPTKLKSVGDYKARLSELMAQHGVKDKTKMEPGMLVWGKMEGWPEWPGEIADVKGDVSEAVLAARPSDKKALLVRFFDPPRTSAWIARSRLYMLGDSDELDGLLTDKRHIRQAKKLNNVRAALRAAQKAMTTPTASGDDDDEE